MRLSSNLPTSYSLIQTLQRLSDSKWGHYHTKADVVVPEVRKAPEASGAAHVSPIIVKRPVPQHPENLPFSLQVFPAILRVIRILKMWLFPIFTP
jgi:hypothetical protein